MDILLSSCLGFKCPCQQELFMVWGSLYLSTGMHLETIQTDELGEAQKLQSKYSEYEWSSKFNICPTQPDKIILTKKHWLPNIQTCTTKSLFQSFMDMNTRVVCNQEYYVVSNGFNLIVYDSKLQELYRRQFSSYIYSMLILENQQLLITTYHKLMLFQISDNYCFLHIERHSFRASLDMIKFKEYWIILDQNTHLYIMKDWKIVKIILQTGSHRVLQWGEYIISFDGNTTIWDTATWNKVRSIDNIDSAGVTHDGKLILGGSNGKEPNHGVEAFFQVWEEGVLQYTVRLRKEVYTRIKNIVCQDDYIILITRLHPDFEQHELQIWKHKTRIVSKPINLENQYSKIYLHVINKQIIITQNNGTAHIYTS